MEKIIKMTAAAAAAVRVETGRVGATRRMSSLFLFGLLVVAVSTQILLVDSAPTENRHRLVKSYLRTLGHIDKDNDADINDDDYVKGLRSIQRFAGLRETGELDDATEKLIASPRCGVPDKHRKNRTRRYAIVDTKWPTKYLKYYISNGPAKSLTATQVSAIVKLAFQYWMNVACLNISAASTSTRAQLQVSFRSYNHGDDDPFDGPGFVLAHAFYPTIGMIHFDNSETWTDASTAGTNLLQVAVHEFGHSLGLQHSSVQSAIMYPYYRGYKPSFSLDADDINGIQAIYGKCPTTTTRSTTVNPTTVRTTTTQRTTTAKTTAAKQTTTALPRCVA